MIEPMWFNSVGTGLKVRRLGSFLGCINVQVCNTGQGASTLSIFVSLPICSVLYI